MSFFSKKKDEDIFDFSDSQDEVIAFGSATDEKIKPSHVLTPDEVIGEEPRPITPAAGMSALEALKMRMLAAGSEQDLHQAKKKETEAPAPQKETKDDAPANFDELINTVETEISKKPNIPEKKAEKSLLERCRPFILDDNGSDSAMKSAPAYTLESVSDILESESLKTIEMLKKRYDVSLEDIEKAKAAAEARPASQELIENEETEKEVSLKAPIVISDIDNEDTGDITEFIDISSTSTIKFTPVSGSDAAMRLSRTSQTRQIDFTGEMTSIPESEAEKEQEEVTLEQTEFEEFVPEEEFSDPNKKKHILRLLSINRRNAFLRSSVSVIGVIILAFFKLPFMATLLLSQTKTVNIILTVIFGLLVIANFDMFKSVADIIKKKATPDISAVLMSVAALIYAIASISKTELALNILLLGAITLSFRSICTFFSASSMLLGFKKIISNGEKNAVKLIDDRATTYAMAKDSVEGDILLAAKQNAEHIDDFMKYSTYKVTMRKNLPAISIVSVILAIIVGFASASYFESSVSGFYAAAAIECLSCCPILFFIDNLPLYSAAKKLRSKGAMIAGLAGAERIENANAVVFASNELFPENSISLHNLKVLSDNNIDDTLIRAASLTKALGSPLAAIFQKIAVTGEVAELPPSDTVKYEDRMGISGWVDNKLLFIGNRTLMEAHGISVPDVEFDRKILRKGFFPVYVASEDTACALLMIQYSVDPEISKELRKLSALGVTILVNSTDPNMTEAMICDYMGLYEDSVKVMTAAGCHMYSNAVRPADSVSAPAVYGAKAAGLAAIINSANRIKKSNLLLTVLYILAAVLGTVLFVYISFSGSDTLMGSGTVLLYNLIAAVITYLLYLIQKP